MKASEVLRRYAAGERNFCRTDLRGQSFAGQNLSGANFSEAQLQGTNFTHAILHKVNFTRAKGGLQKRWVFTQVLIALLLSALLGGLASLPGAFIVFFFSPNSIQEYTIVPGIAILTLTVVCFLSILYGGFTLQALSTIASVVVIAFAAIGTGAITISGNGSFAYAGTGASVSVVVIALASVSAVIVNVAGVSAIIAALVGASAVMVSFASVNIGFSVFASAFLNSNVRTGAGVFASLVILLSLYINRYALKGDEKFALARAIGIPFTAIGGTSFCGADLTGANFSHANLKSTNFNHTQQNQTILTHVCWQEAKKLDRARVGDSILANAAVRDLLVTRNGYKKFYVDANLGGANLNGVNLNEANLKGADLSGATFHHANLKAANLREVLAIGADFTGAYLTGACLEAWNIDHTTRLDQVDCQYVFLLEHPNELGNRERRPHDPDQVFQPGDFEKLYRKMINVVQVLLRNGMNRAAFAEAFQQLMDEHPDISYDSIQAIERKGDDALVTLEVAATTDKAKISRSLQTFYEEKVRQLEAKVDRLNELRAADLKEVALAQRETQIFNQLVGGNAMNESTDQSQNFNVGGNFNINATNSVVNLRDISGNVTNTINQLPDRPDSTEPDLKQLLLELQAAIETEPNLPDPDKVEALEQVGTLAKAGQNPQDSTLKKLANTAVKVLKGTVAALPDAAQLAEACTKLLPMITTLIGL